MYRFTTRGRGAEGGGPYGGCTTELARGWRAQIVDDEEDPEMDAYVFRYCPRCAQREFGPSEPSHREQDR